MSTSDLANDILNAFRLSGIEKAEQIISEASSLRDLRDALSDLEDITPRTEWIVQLISKLRARIEDLDYDFSP